MLIGAVTWGIGTASFSIYVCVDANSCSICKRSPYSPMINRVELPAQNIDTLYTVQHPRPKPVKCWLRVGFPWTIGPDGGG